MSPSPINMTLYRLLVKQGASEVDAEAAARTDTAESMSRLTLRTELLEMEVRLGRLIIVGLVTMAGIVALITGLVRMAAR